jgi:outer membrane lipoprotein-sorting protein
MTSLTTRRAALAGLIALPWLAPLLTPSAYAQDAAGDDSALLAKAAAGLQALKSVRGRFQQTDARGGVTEGSLYLMRPGRARFAYDPPSGLTVVSDGYNVTVADSRLQTFQRYPLMTTPLALFLAKEIRLDQGVHITRVERRPNGFSVTARDGGRKTRGSITLDFGEGDPAPLKGWSLIDAQGAQTRVRITSLAAAPGLDRDLFIIRDPHPIAPTRR